MLKQLEGKLKGYRYKLKTFNGFGSSAAPTTINLYTNDKEEFLVAVFELSPSGRINLEITARTEHTLDVLIISTRTLMEAKERGDLKHTTSIHLTLPTALQDNCNMQDWLRLLEFKAQTVNYETTYVLTVSPSLMQRVKNIFRN